MRLQFLTLLLTSTSYLLSGCGHMHKVDGPQAKEELPSGVRVGIGGKEVNEGDTLSVFKPKCHKIARGRRGTETECHDKEIGKAKVLKILDHDSAIVEPQNGLVMDNTMKVEKQGE